MKWSLTVSGALIPLYGNRFCYHTVIHVVSQIWCVGFMLWLLQFSIEELWGLYDLWLFIRKQNLFKNLEHLLLYSIYVQWVWSWCCQFCIANSWPKQWLRNSLVVNMVIACACIWQSFRSSTLSQFPFPSWIPQHKSLMPGVRLAPGLFPCLLVLAVQTLSSV